MTETYWILAEARDGFLTGKSAKLWSPSYNVQLLSITVDPEEVEVFKEKPDNRIWYIKLKHPKAK